jgi:uncharacterized protein DUF3987
MNNPTDNNPELDFDESHVSNDEIIAMLREINRTTPPGAQPLDSDLPFSLSSGALYGLPGDIVRTLDPYTEASPVAVLLTVLVYFGNVIGRGSYYMIGPAKHHANIFAGIIGLTAKARKGTSRSYPDHMFEQIDRDWLKDRFSNGLASGEALVSEVQDVVVTDKRLVVVEEEFSRVLKTMSRDGNILSELLRCAWDGRPLRNIRAQDRVTATDAHISLLAHTTPGDLKKNLTTNEQANGFGNRFLWAYSERSKMIAHPKPVPEEKLKALIDRLQDAVKFAKEAGEVKFSPEAGVLWGDFYYALGAQSHNQMNIYTNMTAREEAQIIRLSMIYALMDKSALIEQEHLKAARTLWDYCAMSVKQIFGDHTGDYRVDILIDELSVRKELTKTEITKLFKNNLSQKMRDDIIQTVLDMNIAEWRTKKLGGQTIDLLCWKGSVNP